MNRKQLSWTLLLILLIGLSWAGVAPSRAAGFVVNDSTDDANARDKNPGDGTCESWYNTCTLRAAIEEANALAGADTITFNNQMTIYLDTTEGRLDINSQIRLDASGVWDTANDRPGVNLHGGDQSVNGIAVHGTNVEIYGLFIYNCYTAIAIYSSNNTIGGVGQGQRNVLSNNDLGVYLGTSGAHDNMIQGNWIGLSISGDTKAPNGTGIYITDGAHDNIIGGDTSAKGNYISGNNDYGVYLNGSMVVNNRLGGNIIGLPAIGSLDVGNGKSGVWLVDAQSTNIGVAPDAPNTISRNGEHGVYIVRGQDNDIMNNTISYNTGDGVRVGAVSALNNEIFANSIHHNGGKGIELMDGGNTELASPTITSASGTQVSGTAAGGARVVQVYSDSADEGQVYHGQCVVNTVTNQWVYSGAITGPNATALASDVDGNTSEFSTPYTLSGVCANPLTISCGQTVSGDTSGYGNNIGVYSCSSWNESGPEVIYSFTLASASDVKAEIMNLAVDLDVFLLAAGGCDAGQCLTASSYGDAVATADNVPPGAYYIAVDGFNGAAGAFDLRLTCTGQQYKVFLPLVLRQFP